MKFFCRISFLVCLVAALGFTPFSEKCSMLKNNTFVYKLAGKDVVVKFEEDTHTEYHQSGKYYIKSNVEWISDCEYYLIIQEVNLPDFPFKIGSKLHIEITKVRGNKLSYKSTMGARIWEGKMTKKRGGS